MTAFQPGSPAYEALIAERAELRADNARLRADNAEMLRALKLAYRLPRPWMDGGVTSKQWIEAYDAIFTIIDKSPSP